MHKKNLYTRRIVEFSHKGVHFGVGCFDIEFPGHKVNPYAYAAT